MTHRWVPPDENPSGNDTPGKLHASGNELVHDQSEDVRTGG
ncbi:hypothetical protein [Streptomyces hawaiiensis]|nr:hypothetical protein [Streptomyces hawaiiensis]